MYDIRLCVCGSRTITNIDFIFSEIKKYCHENKWTNHSFTLVEGGASGVDQIARQFAQKYKMPVDEIKADWNSYGKVAGVIRNRKMIESCDFVLIVWDGFSRGTKNDIEICQKLGKNYKLILSPTLLKRGE